TNSRLPNDVLPSPDLAQAVPQPPPARLLPAHLLGEVVGNTEFLDGMQLSYQKIGVPLFVADHALEQRPGAAIASLVADLRGFVVVTNRVLLVFEVDLNLLLHIGAKSRLECDRGSGNAFEKDDAFDESFGVLHFLNGPRLGEIAQPFVAPALADLGLRHVLGNGRQLGEKSRIQLLDYFLVTLHWWCLRQPSSDLGERRCCDPAHKGRFSRESFSGATVKRVRGVTKNGELRSPARTRASGPPWPRVRLAPPDSRGRLSPHGHSNCGIALGPAASSTASWELQFSRTHLGGGDSY